MFRINRRIIADSALVGVLLTFLVAAADAGGVLAHLERWFYDQRARHCQASMPPPTDRLVHVDIDDAALEAVGRWPWDRAVLAEILDEIALAKPRVIGLDVLLSEPQEPQWRRLPNGQFEIVDHDQVFADAVKRAGNVIVSARLPFEQAREKGLRSSVRELLVSDPTMTEAEVSEYVEAARRAGNSRRDAVDRVAGQFHSIRRAALGDRIASEPPDLSREELLARILPGVDDAIDSPLLNAFNGEYARARGVRQFQRFAVPAPHPRPPLFSSTLSEVPVERIGAAAAAGGFVDYLQSEDGKVRSFPLFMEARGKVYPQFGVALACKFLGSNPAAIRMTKEAVIVPRPQGNLAVPVRTIPPQQTLNSWSGRSVPLVADVSWFGSGRWDQMYGPGGHRSVANVFDVCLLRKKIIQNNRAADDAMGEVMPEELFDEFLKKPLAPDDVDGFNRRIALVLEKVDYSALESLPAEKRAEGKKTYDRAVAKLKAAREQNPLLREQLAQQRDRLRADMEGRAVLVGWTATASIADFLPTSLNPRTPGVVLHGVIFNQILTGEVWRTLPKWAVLLATVVFGLLATAAVTFLSPGKALAAAIALLAGYMLLNGFVLFDKYNLVLGVAGPVVAIGASWSGGTLAKLLLERWERARITRRFRSYADPKLVDYVLKHPDQPLFEGQVRELTVVFVDLVGFTHLTETMGASAVQLLNELWETLIPVIKDNDAYVNKFLGDGLMFLYGAPEQSPRHARDAVNTVFAVRKALDEFNWGAVAKGWPAQGLRFGISTGNMVVGDAGAPRIERADYTVIGDAVNLGARLESANKAVGTTSLLTGRTVELAGDEFLFRPIGKLQVVGKQEGVMTYEVLARRQEATGEQKSLAADTEAVVAAFLSGDLKACMDAIGRFESRHGNTKLTALYRARCEYFMQDPPPAPFDGQIALTEK